jgi:antitoxin (DNA-binding transcriptional repressor) of toxin-antitoxin stability system
LPIVILAQRLKPIQRESLRLRERGRPPSEIRFDLIASVLTITEVARNFSAIIDKVEAEQEDIILIRNQRAVTRLVPEPPAQNAVEVLGDLYRTLDNSTANALAKAIKSGRKSKRGTLRELRNPWAS